MEFEVEEKVVVEEPIISEIDSSTFQELGYKSLKYSYSYNRLTLTTIEEEVVVVPNELVEDKLKEILAAIYENKNK